METSANTSLKEPKISFHVFDFEITFSAFIENNCCSNLFTFKTTFSELSEEEKSQIAPKKKIIITRRSKTIRFI